GTFGGADFTVSDFPDIDARKFSRDVSGRNRSDEITGEGDDQEPDHRGTPDPSASRLDTSKLLRLSQIDRMDISAGVIPLIRAAWPNELGRMLVSFCRVSARKPATALK